MLLLNTIQLSIRCLQYSNVLRVTSVESVTQIQRYCKWIHRNPVTILNEDEILEEDNEEVTSDAIAEEPRALRRRRRLGNHKRSRIAKKRELKVEGVVSSGDTGNPVFTKVWDNDKVLSKLLMKIKSRKERDKQNQILLEGHRLIKDAIYAGVVPELIIFSRSTDIEKLPLPKTGVNLYKVPYRSIQLWSSLTTAPGLMGIFKTPTISDVKPSPGMIPLTIICDNVREPGNLGSILRAAAGVGCKQVILMKGCVDLWESKVLRSAAGAHFRLPICRNKSWYDMESVISDSADIFIADNNVHIGSKSDSASESSEAFESNSGTSSHDVDKLERSIVPENCLDNEQNESEALNAPEIIADDYKEREKSDTLVRDTSKNKWNSRQIEKSILEDLTKSIPVMPYYDANYAKKEIVLIIGGESEGLSRESLTLVHDRRGKRVNVPLMNGVDSLNVGVALGIIAFEMKRQLMTRQSTDE